MQPGDRYMQMLSLIHIYPMQHLYGYHFGGSLPHLPSTQEEESRQYCFIYPCHHRGSLLDARLQSAATCAQHEGR